MFQRLEREMTIIEEKEQKKLILSKKQRQPKHHSTVDICLFGFPPLPAIVTTRIITCSLGSLQTPSFASVTGEGGIPYM